MTAQATPAQNQAYRASLCIDCKTRPYSAGRTRCNSCHAKWWNDDKREAQ